MIMLIESQKLLPMHVMYFRIISEQFVVWATTDRCVGVTKIDEYKWTMQYIMLH